VLSRDIKEEMAECGKVKNFQFASVLRSSAAAKDEIVDCQLKIGNRQFSRLNIQSDSVK